MLKKVSRVKESFEAVEHNVILNGTEVLPYALQRRLEALQDLKSYEGKAEYGRKQIEVAEELGISLRSLYRYIKRYRKDGLEGITRRERSESRSIFCCFLLGDTFASPDTCCTRLEGAI
jgi:DNA invertase Pin-like site-specific DNA recombinase